VAAWAPRLASGAPRVGLVWSGNPVHRNDHNRSIPLATLLPLTATGVALHALQHGIRAGDRDALAAMPPLIDLGSGFRDFADTAAVIAGLDLVIAVDTSVAHLAASLGKPTWVLLPFVADWRWLLGRDDSPWYPSVRLFRQTARGDWAGVVERVGRALADFVPAAGERRQ
jgi:hypothetical protein